ncbi:MAG: hypothetical protein OHK0015_21790 [Chloroflexi bacterium OHK40]
MPDKPRPDERSTWRRQIEAIIETQIARSPFLVQMRAVLRQLRYERENWPLLIPFLLAWFFFVYRRERGRLLALQRRLEEDD